MSEKRASVIKTIAPDPLASVGGNRDVIAPPYDDLETAERIVIGKALGMDGRAMRELEWLSPEAFLYLRHGWIWDAILRVYRRDGFPDRRMVEADLREHGRLDDAGGADYLLRCVSESLETLESVAFAHYINRQYIRRLIRGAAGQIAVLTDDPDIDTPEVVTEAHRLLAEATERYRPDGMPIPNREVVSDMLDAFGLGNKLRVPLGFGNLNTALRGGMRGGRLMYVGARPNMGKSLFLLTLAKNAAEAGYGVMYVTLEMPVWDNVYRLAAMKTGVPADRIEEVHATGEGPERKRVGDALAWAADLPIYWSTTARTPQLLRDELAAGRRLYQIDLIVGDHLNLMRSGDVAVDRHDYARQTYVSRRMKELALETGLPVIWAVQLGRGVEERNDKRPQLSDFRDSGAIEEDADVAVMLYRDDYYCEDSESPGILEALVRKNRQGPTVNCLFSVDLPVMRIKETAGRHKGEKHVPPTPPDR